MTRPRKSLERLVARLFVAGFTGTTPDPLLLQLIGRGLGGAILFKRNLPDLETALAVNHRLAEAAGDHPLVLCLDQEGGRVQRLGAPLLQLPPMRLLGEHGTPRLCRLAGRLLGRELAAAGFHLDLAPVFDIDSNPLNPVIGDRAFGQTAAAVIRAALPFALGLEAGGVAACAKHFPGHGDTHEDSHLTLPALPFGLDRLRGQELLPFAEAGRRRLSCLMMAHLRVPALDPVHPTSLSAAAYQLARAEAGFRGLILTDDLEMKAVSEHPGVVASAVLAIAGGADGVLICHQPALVEEAIAAVCRAVELGEIDRQKLVTSNRRWDRLARKFGAGRRRPDPAALEGLFASPERARLLARLEKLL